MDETVFRSPSPDDYRSVVADSTSGTYRRISAEGLERPAEYNTIMNSGQQTNGNRQRLPEPPQEVQLGGMSHPEVMRGHDVGRYGVGEVDFDPKFTEAYANLDDVRDRNYQLASASESPERRPSTMFKGVVNDSKKHQRRKCGCRLSTCLLIVLILALFLINLALGLFNFFNTYKNGEIVTNLSPSPITSPLPSNGILATIDLLREMLEEMNRNFSSYKETYSVEINSINSQIRDLSNTLASTSASPTPSPTQLQVNVDQHCTTVSGGLCTIGRSKYNSNPAFSSCTTPSYNHTDSSTYIADAYCSIVTEDEVMPVAATINFANGVWSCVCNGIQIPVQFQQELTISDCILYVKKCPKVISINLE